MFDPDTTKTALKVSYGDIRYATLPSLQCLIACLIMDNTKILKILHAKEQIDEGLAQQLQNAIQLGYPWLMASWPIKLDFW